jgi:hypothetical protein
MTLRFRLLLPLLLSALLTGLVASLLWPPYRVGLGWLATGLLAMALLATVGLEILVARPLRRLVAALARAAEGQGALPDTYAWPELDPLARAVETRRASHGPPEGQNGPPAGEAPAAAGSGAGGAGG